MKERWQKVKNEPIKQLKAHIAQQVAKFASRHRGAKYLQDATKEQNSWNYAEAKRIKADLVERIDRGEHIDPNIDIHTLFKPQPTKEKHHEVF
jgi:Sec7-like guanine-nucleotide exchange factor